MAELFTPNARLRAVGARPRDGRDGIMQFFAKLFVPWPTHRDHPDRIIISVEDRVAIAEVTFTGITNAGRPVTFEALDVLDFEGDRIRRLTNWYDIDYARRALAGADQTAGGSPEG